LGRTVARFFAMSSHDALASALALAFLAGPWTRAGLIERGEHVLGERPRWLPALARETLAEFGMAPSDAYASLRDAIERARSFKRGLARGNRQSSLRTLLVSEPGMGTRRWPVPELCTTPDVAWWLTVTPDELDHESAA
jgi:RNA-directed DNA polymerase